MRMAYFSAQRELFMEGVQRHSLFKVHVAPFSQGGLQCTISHEDPVTFDGHLQIPKSTHTPSFKQPEPHKSEKLIKNSVPTTLYFLYSYFFFWGYKQGFHYRSGGGDGVGMFHFFLSF